MIRKDMKEFPKLKIESDQLGTVSIEAGFESLVPNAFRLDPFNYFQTHGVNVKRGEIQRKDTGEAREDSTAVKDLPDWVDEYGAKVGIVAKRVNPEKSQVGKTSDPFYECRVMHYVRSLGLPAPELIAKASRGSDERLFVMRRVPGFRPINNIGEQLKERGFTEDDLKRLKQEAETMMADLEKRFLASGIERAWKLSDMVIDIDINTKQITSMVPTDWERTKITSWTK